MNLIVLSGGRHPYEESTPVLEKFLTAAGHGVTVTGDASVLADADAMGQYDALVFNTLREGASTLTPDEQAGFKSFIAGGKGFVCIHISGCEPETWREYGDITGGGWIMGKSYHPPYGRYTVNVTQPGHPGVEGVSDFVTNDELYMGLESATATTSSWPPTRKRGPTPGAARRPSCPRGLSRLDGPGRTATAACS